MRGDLVVGNEFPDISLPEHTGKELSLEVIARQQPLVLAFVHGSWCPKVQIRLRNLVDAQDELQREYGRIAVATVDEPYVNGAFRAGIGADFPFLSDEERRIADELDLLELTDELHRPLLPYTLVLDSNRVIRAARIPTRSATTSPCRASRFRTCRGPTPAMSDMDTGV
jgi:peroxiredoxin